MSGAASVPDNALGRFGIGVLVVTLALFVASAVTAPTTGAAIAAGLVAEGSTGAAVLRTVVQFLAMLVAVGGYLAATGEWDLVPVAAPGRREVALAVAGVVALLALQYGSLYGLAAVGVEPGQNVATVPQGDPVAYYLALIAVSLLVVGPVEEVLFRGVVQGGLRRAVDALPAIVVAGALFGLIHVPAVEGGPVEQLAYAGVATGLGCLLGYLHERTDNVVVPALAHGGYNAAIYATLLSGSL